MVLPKERVPKLGIRWQGKSAISRGWGWGFYAEGTESAEDTKKRGSSSPTVFREQIPP